MKYTTIQPAGGDTATPLNVAKRLAIILRYYQRSNTGAKRLIDCGCGAGGYIMALEARGVRACGIEYDREKLRDFKRQQPAMGNFFAGDISKAAVRDGTFDVALINEVLEHVPEDAAALAEAHRMLKDDGFLILFSPNRRYPFETHGVTWTLTSWRVPHYFPFIPYVPVGVGTRFLTYWARNYWPGELRRMVRKAGFTIVETGYVWQTFEGISTVQPRLITVLAPVLRKTANLLERIPVLRSLGASQVIVARKNGACLPSH